MNSSVNLNVDFIAVNHVPFVAGLPQKKGISRFVCEMCFLCRSVVFCQPVSNVPNVAQNLPMGTRLGHY